MDNNGKDFLDNMKDLFEVATTTQTSRTGHAAALIAKNLDKDVDPVEMTEVINKASKKSNPKGFEEFTVNDLYSIEKLYKACKRRTVYSKKAAKKQLLDVNNKMPKTDDAFPSHG